MPKARRAARCSAFPARACPIGDLLVEILVKTPTNLSARQEELLREFESSAEESIGDKIIKGVENLLGGKSKKKKK